MRDKLRLLRDFVLWSGPLRWIFASALVTALLMLAVPFGRPLFDVSYSPVLYSREGALLGAQVAADGQWRFPPAGNLNEKFVTALLEAEDRRFRQHPGVDPFAVVRAARQNIRRRAVVSGASTITMQTIRLSRNAGGPRRRNMPEKMTEAALALLLEMRKSKDEILLLYAANAPFGANVVGLEAAAWRWFGRSSQELSWAEAATLAVLPNSPGLIHPGRNREALQNRRNRLLERLYQRGHFDEETLRLARAERLPAEPLPLPRLAPHLLSRLVIEAGGVASFRANGVLTNGAMITTIDRDIQERAAEIMNRASERFSAHGIMNAAALIIDTRTGEVAAYVGNTRSPRAADVNIVTSWRSSGSLLKPFLYAAMLDSGDILPSSLVSDIPTRVGSFSPQNMSRTYLGVVPADEALARSLNVPAARGLRTYGVDRFARLLRSMGLTTLFRPGAEYGLPLVLGGAEVTLWEMTGLYAGLGRAAQSHQGEDGSAVFFHPTVFPRETRSGNTRHRGAHRVPQQLPVSPGAAWLTLEALASTARPGDEARWQEHASAHRIGWKTGTSFGFRDAWAIGVTPEWTVGVWVGNATGEGRAELRSSLTSAPVLFELFLALDALAGRRGGWFPSPSAELRLAESCAASGFLAGPHCSRIRVIDLPRNASASGVCPFCRPVVLNAAGDRRVTLGNGFFGEVTERTWFVLPPAEEWFFRRWNLDYRPLPPEENPGLSRAALPGERSLALFNPEPGAQIFIPRELDGREGRIVFSAAHRDETEIIHWHLDGDFLGITQTFHEMEARPSAGQRSVTLVDSEGNTLTRHFVVLENVE